MKDQPAFPSERDFNATEIALAHQGGYAKTMGSKLFSPGMTMRQYYKAAALQGNIRDRNKTFKEYADDAGKMADAMLAEDLEHEKRESK